METAQLEAFARGLGALPAAVEDVVRRAVNHFGDTEPDGETLATWGQQLRAQCTHLFVAAPQHDLAAVAARHGMSVELWQSLTAEEKYTRERQWLATHGQAPGPKQKQGNYIASGEDLKALEGKSVVERLTYARERAAQQQTG
jgi:hypothetical protein